MAAPAISVATGLQGIIRIMAYKQDKVKVLLAQFSLETHSRGLVTVASMLRNEGMEVILLGNASPERIIESAAQEDADVIGISTYCGGELVLATDLMNAAERQKMRERTVFLIGGIYPPDNALKLIKMGFSGVFPPSTTREQITSCIHNALAARREGCED